MGRKHRGGVSDESHCDVTCLRMGDVLEWKLFWRRQQSTKRQAEQMQRKDVCPSALSKRVDPATVFVIEGFGTFNRSPPPVT
jgi:hypothetical protein